MPAVSAPFCVAHNINVVILLNASVILKVVVLFVAGTCVDKMDFMLGDNL